MASQTALIARHVQDIKWQVLNMTREMAEGFAGVKEVRGVVAMGINEIIENLEVFNDENFAELNLATVMIFGMTYMLIGIGSLGMATILAKSKRMRMKSGLAIFLSLFFWPVYWIVVFVKEKSLLVAETDEASALAQRVEEMNTKMVEIYTELRNVNENLKKFPRFNQNIPSFGLGDYRSTPGNRNGPRVHNDSGFVGLGGVPE